MVIRGKSPAGCSLTANLQPGALTLAVDEQTVLAYDRAGRLWSAFMGGVTYRRGYNGRIMAKHRAGGQRARRWLGEDEAAALLARISKLARQVSGSSGQWDAPPAALAQLQEALSRAAAFDPQMAAQDAQRFNAIYLPSPTRHGAPVGILPPDQYMALVLQMTVGCSFNTCTFCTFYRDRPFHIKTPAEFQAHSAAVLEYMGPALPMRKSVFLADANALVAPQKQLVELLNVAQSVCSPALPCYDYYAFLDGFSGAKKSPQEYAALGKRGLKRIYIGLESGYDPLLRFLNKPGTAADAIATVRAIQAGGLHVGLIVLLGAGGARFAKEHIWYTIEVVNQMKLGANDLLYFSELVEQPEQPYGALAAQNDINPLSSQQMLEQRRAIQTELRFDGPPPKISTYDIREFVY